MSRTVSVFRNRIYVDGQKCEPISRKYGGYRLVAVTPDDLVVKADIVRSDHDTHYSYQTEKECWLWGRIESRDRRYFPEVLHRGTGNRRNRVFSWLIQKKIDISSQTLPTWRTVNTLNRLRDKYRIADLDTGRVGREVGHSSNWACIGGRPVIFDFGLTY